MKKISTYLFATTVGFLLLTSCSSDDNNTLPEPSNHLLGSWTLNTLSIKSSENGEVISEFIDMQVNGNIVWEYDFKSDNTFSYYMFSPIYQLDEEGTGTYIRNENNLTLTIDGEPEIFTISNIDAENLHLKIMYEGEYEGVHYKEEMEQKFIRN